MLSFLKKIFGAKPAESTAVPYKVEEPEQFPFPKTVAEEKNQRPKNLPPSNQLPKSHVPLENQKPS
jgi:hypothetical protein